MTSFTSGLDTLIHVLVQHLQPSARMELSTPVTRVVAGSSLPHRVETPAGPVDADAIILASPAHATASMVANLDPPMHQALTEIPYAPLCVVCLGYPRESLHHDLDGFGFLIPGSEGRTMLGTLWDSSIFDANRRAPEGQVLLRSMVGGACFPESMEWTDEQILHHVREDLLVTMDISAIPSFVRIFRHAQAIPQYTVSHSHRLESLQQACARHPGLFLVGNAYRGIGLNDCVLSAQRVVDEVLNHLAQ